MRIIAIGSPKGGVGKSTTAVTMAGVAVRSGLSVLVVDGDRNRSALDWCDAAGDALPVDVAEADDPDQLRRLRTAGGYDVAIVDLPGARAGAFEAVLAGSGKPVPDLLVVPVFPETLDLRPVLRVVRAEVAPLGLPYLLTFTRVPTHALDRARTRRDQLRAAGLSAADTIVRRYTAYDEAAERGVTVLDLPGAHSYARSAESDYRALTVEAFAAAGVPTPTEVS